MTPSFHSAMTETIHDWLSKLSNEDGIRIRSAERSYATDENDYDRQYAVDPRDTRLRKFSDSFLGHMRYCMDSTDSLISSLASILEHELTLANELFRSRPRFSSSRMVPVSKET
jgi:hypothetical protein